MFTLDVCGPIRTPTISGNKYFVTFIDDYSRYSRVYLLKCKSEVLEKLKEFKELAETYTGNKLKVLQSDNGTEYINRDFDTYLKRCGIQRRLSAPHTAHQNGLAERKNRTLVENARALMIDANAPLKCWGEAIMTANYLSNRNLNSAIENKTPLELWVGRKPIIHHLYIFGSKTFVLIKKAIPGMFVGYSETSKAFKILLPSKNKVVISKDIRVIKSMFYDNSNKNNITDIFNNDSFFESPEPSKPSRLPRKQVTIQLDDNEDGDVTPLNDIGDTEDEDLDDTLQPNSVNSTEDVQQSEPQNLSEYESLSGSHNFVDDDEPSDLTDIEDLNETIDPHASTSTPPLTLRDSSKKV